MIQRLMYVFLAFLIAIPSWMLSSNVREVEAESPERAALVDTYTINTEKIQSGNTYTLNLNLVDDNFRENIAISSPYVKPTNSSSFLFSEQQGIYENNLQFDPNNDGINIHLRVEGLWQIGGDTLSLFYGFHHAGHAYENVVTCYIKEANQVVSKEEGEIKGYELPEGDSSNRESSHLAEEESDGVQQDPVNDERVKDAQKWLNDRYTGHAGFYSSTDVINDMWMKALLNSDAYVVVSGGDVRIREAQQTLNQMYYSYFGIKPCDGHYSRETNQALIYGWQCEEGIDVATATGTFGPTTKARCPSLPRDSRYTQDHLNNFIRLEQYALYFNEATGYQRLLLDTQYSKQVYSCVSAFSEFMVLPLRDGTSDVGTIMSLMVSTGNPDRPAEGCDCATQLDTTKAQTLYQAGYRYVGRYLTGSSAVGPKNLSVNEYIALSRMGLRLFPIYQDGNERKDHFTAAQGYTDANLACDAAENLCISDTTIIYFAVDYDFMDEELNTTVIPYFQGVRNAIGARASKSQSTYKVGIYGSRNICTRVSDKGLAVSSFVSDMSSGYSGNYGVRMPDNWAFDQFNEFNFSAGGFALDKDAVSGRDLGIALNVPDFSYDRQAMRSYAEQWWDSYNTAEYHKYSQDCANYASQCLHAGGFAMTDGWYSSGHSSAESLEDSNLQTDEVAASWRLAQNLYNYFSSNLPYKSGEVLYLSNADDIPSIIKQAKAEGNPIQAGDLIMMAPHGTGSKGISHATVVSSVDDNMICYTAHTKAKFDEPLKSAFENGKECYIIRFRDSWAL